CDHRRFLFSSRRRHTRCLSDWSSDVCSSDLSGSPRVVTYTYDDVVNALNAVAPSDWRAFFDTRLHSLSPHAPLGGITGSGWRLEIGRASCRERVSVAVGRV